MTWSPLRERLDDMRPLLVTAHMSEPILYSGDGLHLDGILAAAAFRDLDEQTRRRMPPLESEWPVDIALPLARWVVDVGAEWPGDERLLRRRGKGRKSITTELWGWRASAVQATWAQHGKAEVRKKPELAGMRRYAADRTVELGAGPLKAYDLAFPTAFAPMLHWYAFGGEDEVRRLLTTHIQALGKKHNLGHGTVMRWTVEPCAEDRSVVDGDRIMRRMPVQSCLAGHLHHGAIRPPYHHHSRVVECVGP